MLALCTKSRFPCFLLVSRVWARYRPLLPIINRAVSNFFEKSRRYSQLNKWQKSSNWKILIILFGHLWVVELTYIKIFAFKFSLRWLQPDIVPIICHRCYWHRWQICRRRRWYRWQFATGVVDTGGKFNAGIVDTGGKFATGINNTNEIGGKICRRCRWQRWQIRRRCRWYGSNFAAGVVDTGGKFAPGVVDTGGAPLIEII